MRIAQINTVSYGSTGKIMLQIAEKARTHSHKVQTYSPVPAGKRKVSLSEIKNHFYFGSWFSNTLNLMIGRFTGYQNCFSLFSTHSLIKHLKKFSPDIIHLHNLHNTYINLSRLFSYIKKNNIRVIWTLHDCWSFTGQCPYFAVSKCDKWKTGCCKCSSYREYPSAYVDRTKAMWRKKKKWFTGVKDMTIVTPSQWLADLVKQSFLKDYTVKVLNNGIDLNDFVPSASDFRARYNCEDKYILLGVAFGWGYRKGLDVFVELSHRVDDRFKIVLVGTDDMVDKELPKNIISIHRTNDQKELAEIYTAADLFVNPTREENYPTVNMESIACGTPVLTFRTGGSPEMLDETCGVVVNCDDIDAMEKEILRICEESPFNKEACLKKAKSFDMNDRFKEYVKLYEDSISV